MSINIYPAHKQGNTIIPANDFDEKSTFNMANASFYATVRLLKAEHLMKDPGHCTVHEMRMLLRKHGDKTVYKNQLNAICAAAEIMRARYIAFS